MILLTKKVVTTAFANVVSVQSIRVFSYADSGSIINVKIFNYSRYCLIQRTLNNSLFLFIIFHRWNNNTNN